MCSAIERPVIESLLSELCIPRRSSGELILEVHQGRVCHLKLKINLGVSLDFDDPSDESSYREQRVHVRRLSPELQAEVQQLADEHVGRHGRVVVNFDGSCVTWDFRKTRR